VIETPRLRGERIGPEHHDGLLVLLGDPRVGATLGGTWTSEKVLRSIDYQRAHWERHGFGFWAWLDRRTGALVARGGLGATEVGGPGSVEVAWSVVPERWGQGYATELGSASIAVGFGTLGLPELVSFTLPHNAASRRVMEKLGFEYEREVVHADLPHVLYRLRQSPGSA
jgi:[ribosomal protein S5]-alanine N-acetyltransferase